MNHTQQEFVERIHQHRPVLHKLCNLYCDSTQDREDLFQEILVQLWKSYPKFRGESKFSTWMYRIALNTAISDLRRHKKRIPRVDPETQTLSIHDPQPGPEQEDQLRQLYAAINQLTEIERALVMLYLEDKTYQEMEEILGMSENSLRVRMNRIKEKLRNLTKEADHGNR